MSRTGRRRFHLASRPKLQTFRSLDAKFTPRPVRSIGRPSSIVPVTVKRTVASPAMVLKLRTKLEGLTAMEASAAARLKLDASSGFRADSHFEAVADAVAVGVPQQRTGSSSHFLAVGQTVSVGVGVMRIGAEQVFLEIGQAVVVRIFLRVHRVVRIQTVRDLVLVGDTISVGVGAGRSDPDRRDTRRAFERRLDHHRSALHGLHQPVGRNRRNRRVADRVLRSTARRDVPGGAVGIPGSDRQLGGATELRQRRERRV